MIKNERQYRITKAQAEKFARAIKHVISEKSRDPLLQELEMRALQSQFDELNQQLIEYRQLQSGARGVISVESFDLLPKALVQARIASGLSQKELAEKLGLKEQQIQRYEATEYSAASLSRIKEVIAALGIKVREEIFLPPNASSVGAFLERLKSAGVDRNLVYNRLLPARLAERLFSSSQSASETEIRQAASIISRIYGWSVEKILGGDPLRLNAVPAGIARFKLPRLSDERKRSAYTVYAHHLASLVLEATPKLKACQVPDDAMEFRDAFFEEFDELSFVNVLEFNWSLGIPVLPLPDSAAFHGACWRIRGRNVIVLKQRTQSVARWINDCLHEIYHASQEPEKQERAILEEPEMSPERLESDEEQEACLFAGDVMLDGRAEELIQMCVAAANGFIPRLKAVVPMVAESEDVEVGALANYLAYRLSLQGINWWGTATNLQRGDESPFDIARSWLLPRLSMERLDDTDRLMLLQALMDTERI